MTDQMLSTEEVNTLTGDDITYWLSNPFMTPDLLAEKVRWWVTTATQAVLAGVASPPGQAADR